MKAAMAPSVCWTYREVTHRRHAQSSRGVSSTNVNLTLRCLLVLLGPMTPEPLLYVLLCRKSGGERYNVARLFAREVYRRRPCI